MNINLLLSSDKKLSSYNFCIVNYAQAKHLYGIKETRNDIDEDSEITDHSSSNIWRSI